MEPKHREQILRIVDGEQAALPIMFHAMKLRQREGILSYLIGNKITGKRLLSYYEQQNGSILNLLADIIRRADKEKRKQKIFAKDFLSGR